MRGGMFHVKQRRMLGQGKEDYRVSPPGFAPAGQKPDIVTRTEMRLTK